MMVNYSAVSAKHIQGNFCRGGGGEGVRVGALDEAFLLF